MVSRARMLGRADTPRGMSIGLYHSGGLEQGPRRTRGGCGGRLRWLMVVEQGIRDSFAVHDMPESPIAI